MFDPGIYKILNRINSKFYIGSAISISRRWREHKSDLNLNAHANGRLQNAWNKYGSDAFEFEILEYCLKEILILREQHWLDITESYDRDIGYNISRIAGSMLGYKHSEQTIKNMSDAKKKKGMSAEHREILSKIHKNKIISLDHRAIISAANKGKVLSEETRKRISEAKKNISDETRARMSKGQTGRKHSPETLAKMSASIKAAFAAKRN